MIHSVHLFGTFVTFITQCASLRLNLYSDMFKQLLNSYICEMSSLRRSQHWIHPKPHKKNSSQIPLISCCIVSWATTLTRCLSLCSALLNKLQRKHQGFGPSVSQGWFHTSLLFISVSCMLLLPCCSSLCSFFYASITALLVWVMEASQAK